LLCRGLAAGDIREECRDELAADKQLEIIADMSNARLPPAAMAAAVGLSLDEFIAWRRRSLAAARAEEARHAAPAPIYYRNRPWQP